MKPLSERMARALIDADLDNGRLQLQAGTLLGTIVGLINRDMVDTVRDSSERHPLTVKGARHRMELLARPIITGQCPNPWHSSAPARRTFICPECTPVVALHD